MTKITQDLAALNTAQLTFTRHSDKTNMRLNSGKSYRFTETPPANVDWWSERYKDGLGRTIRTGLWSNGQGHTFHVAAPA